MNENITMSEAVPAGSVQELPAGRAFEIDPCPANPGEIVQLISILPEGATIGGLLISDEFEVTKVYLGNRQLDLKNCIGQLVPPPPVFIMALVKNLTDKPQMARGAWFLTGNLPPEQVAAAKPKAGGDPGLPSVNGQAPVAVQPQVAPRPVASTVGPLPAAPMPQIHTAPPAAVLSTPIVNSGAGSVVVPGPTPTPSLGTITPGQNEVAVLLQKNEAVQVLNWLTGRNPVTESEKWSIIRQLEASIARQEGRV
jgi:hypothetical protein